MSILKSLQDYLEQFKGMEMRPVMTDGTDNEPTGYAVAPSGNSKTVEDIIGNRTYINNYVFYAREYTTSEIERQDNYEFLDAFFDWIEDNDEKGVYPEIPGYEVESISATNVFLFDIDNDGRGTYQIQLQLRLTKRRCKQWEK